MDFKEKTNLFISLIDGDGDFKKTYKKFRELEEKDKKSLSTLKTSKYLKYKHQK